MANSSPSAPVLELAHFTNDQFPAAASRVALLALHLLDWRKRPAFSVTFSSSKSSCPMSLMPLLCLVEPLCPLVLFLLLIKVDPSNFNHFRVEVPILVTGVPW